MKLDRIDIKILYELQKNGRITNVELAELVNLSPSPCLMRVKKLQSEGYIDGYSAQINIGKLGQTLTVFTEITLKNHRQIDFARFLAAIDKVDQVIECHLVSGGYDYLLKFVTAGIGEYQTIMERLTDMDVGIDKYFSFVVLKSPIVKAHMPLTSLFAFDSAEICNAPGGPPLSRQGRKVCHTFPDLRRCDRIGTLYLRQ